MINSLHDQPQQLIVEMISLFAKDESILLSFAALLTDEHQVALILAMEDSHQSVDKDQEAATETQNKEQKEEHVVVDSAPRRRRELLSPGHKLTPTGSLHFARAASPLSTSSFVDDDSQPVPVTPSPLTPQSASIPVIEVPISSQTTLPSIHSIAAVGKSSEVMQDLQSIDDLTDDQRRQQSFEFVFKVRAKLTEDLAAYRYVTSLCCRDLIVIMCIAEPS